MNARAVSVVGGLPRPRTPMNGQTTSARTSARGRPLRGKASKRGDRAGRSATAQQAAQRRLQAPAFAAEVFALVAPSRKARLDLAPEPSRMIGVHEVAELMDQHVFER